MKTILISLVLGSLIFSVPDFDRAQAATAPNPEVEAIRKEMEQMQKEYEQRIRSLEERLQKVEAAAATNAATNAVVNAGTNAAPPAAALGKGYMYPWGGAAAGSSEAALAQQNKVIQDRVQKVLNDFFDFNGYFRSGYGRDNQGGPQPAFQAPGAFAKYRLGNEAETYGELIFGKNWYVPDLFSPTAPPPAAGTPTGPIARTQIRVAFYDPYTTTSTSFQTSLPEAWASIGNVFEAQPELKFWGGERFYRRQDIHINDFFFYNMSGAGGGAEDYETPFGKLALAWIGNGVQDGIYSSDIAVQPDISNEAGFSKQSVVLSLYDVPMPWGKGEFGLVFTTQKSGKTATGTQAPDSEGGAITFIHTHEKFIDDEGINKISLQFGSGSAKTFTSGFETTTLTNGTFIVPDEWESYRFRATESFVANPWERLSISPAVVYQFTDYKNFMGHRQWISAGVRPIYHFNKYFSLALEPGMDHVDDSGIHQSGTLYKISLAPQVSLGDKFFSRPVIRTYVTYAVWSDSFKGEVGGPDFVNETAGWTWGIQMEAWW
jgi:maltoporin